MRIFNLNRIAYFDELAKDPSIDKAIEESISKPWILASDDRGWTKEFQDLKNISIEDSLASMNIMSATLDGDKFNIDINYHWNPFEGGFWYNPSLDLILINNSSAYRRINIEAVKEYLGKFNKDELENLDGKRLRKELFK